MHRAYGPNCVIRDIDYNNTLPDIELPGNHLNGWYCDLCLLLKTLIDSYTEILMYWQLYWNTDVLTVILKYWCIDSYTGILMYWQLYWNTDVLTAILKYWCIDSYTGILMYWQLYWYWCIDSYTEILMYWQLYWNTDVLAAILKYWCIDSYTDTDVLTAILILMYWQLYWNTDVLTAILKYWCIDSYTDTDVLTVILKYWNTDVLTAILKYWCIDNYTGIIMYWQLYWNNNVLTAILKYWCSDIALLCCKVSTCTILNFPNFGVVVPLVNYNTQAKTLSDCNFSYLQKKICCHSENFNINEEADHEATPRSCWWYIPFSMMFSLVMLMIYSIQHDV